MYMFSTWFNVCAQIKNPSSFRQGINYEKKTTPHFKTMQWGIYEAHCNYYNLLSNVNTHVMIFL